MARVLQGRITALFKMWRIIIFRLTNYNRDKTSECIWDEGFCSIILGVVPRGHVWGMWKMTYTVRGHVKDFMEKSTSVDGFPENGKFSWLHLRRFLIPVWFRQALIRSQLICMIMSTAAIVSNKGLHFYIPVGCIFICHRLKLDPPPFQKPARQRRVSNSALANPKRSSWLTGRLTSQTLLIG